MNQSITVKRLLALAHEGRLELFRRLVERGPDGEGAGELARFAGIGATTASARLLVLANAGLIGSSRRGRQVIYRADFDAIGELLGYLVENCCGGRCTIERPAPATRRAR